MAIGDKKAVVMEADRAIANGVATLGEDKLLLPDQRPKADGLYMPDGRTIKETFDEMVSAVSQLPGQNLLDNSVFLPGCLVDQRQGYVVPPGTARWNSAIISWDGVTSKYCTAILPVDGNGNIAFVEDGVTYFTPFTNCVRGYTGAGYGIDRFYTDDTYGTTLITDEGLVLVSGQNNRSQVQFFDFVVQNDTEVTLSALYKGDILLDYWGTTREPKHADDWSVATFTYTIPAGTNLANRFYCPTFKAKVNSTCTIKAAFLDLGDHQKHFYQDSDGNWQLSALSRYEDTLAWCMAYAVQLEKNGGIGIVQNETTAYLIFPLSVPLKLRPGINPVISQNYGKSVWTSKGDTVITNAELIGNYNGKQTLVFVVTGDFSGVQSGSVITSNLFAPFISNDL